MKKHITITVILFILLICNSCATTIKLYDGPELQESDIALLTASAKYYIYKFNNVELKGTPNSTILQVKPGLHDLHLIVKKTQTHQMGIARQTIKYKFDKVVYWNAVAGRKYELRSEGNPARPYSVKVKVVNVTN